MVFDGLSGVKPAVGRQHDQIGHPVVAFRPSSWSGRRDDRASGSAKLLEVLPDPANSLVAIPGVTGRPPIVSSTAYEVDGPERWHSGGEGQQRGHALDHVMPPSS
jgi:hypothetical protein